MIFFSRQMSERLAKLGCKSENGFYWGVLDEGHPNLEFWEPLYTTLSPGWGIPEIADPRKGHFSLRYLQCFSQNDLTGCHPQARENARLVWGSEIIQEFYYTVEHGEVNVPARAFVYHRHAMLDAPDAEKYLEETLK